MNRLFFACITSPRETYARLKADGKRPYVLPLGQPLNEAKAARHDVLLVLSYRHFLQIRESLNGVGADVLLHCAATHARRLSAGVFLDAEVRPGFSTVRFFPFDLSHMHEAPPLGGPVKVADDHLPKLVERARDGSLLNALMTLIYRAGNASLQRTLRQRIVRWFVEDHSDFELLSKIVAKTLEAPANSRLVQALTQVCRNEPYLRVFREIKHQKGKGQPLSYKKLGKNHPAVDMFEVAFMVKTYDQAPSEMSGKSLREIFYSRDRNLKKQRER